MIFKQEFFFRNDLLINEEKINQINVELKLDIEKFPITNILLIY